MENPIERTVRQALRNKAPELYETLTQRGELQGFLDEKVATVYRLVENLRQREKWDYLPHLELVRNLNAARADAVDAVLGEVPELHPSD